MTRISTVSPDEASPELKESYKWTEQQYDVVPEPLAVLVNHPKLFMAYIKQEERATEATTVLPDNVRDIASFRAVSTIGYSWCIDFGSMISQLNGLNIDQLRAIDDYETSPHYSDNERAAIAYADAMTATPPEATDKQVANLERRFGRDGVVELTSQIALGNLHSRVNLRLDITEQGFSSSNACRVPWTNETTTETYDD